MHPCFQASDVLHFYENLSPQILPEFRRKRSYISSILAKNEIDRDVQYNKQLFFRVETGYYIVNPAMEIMVEDEWVNLYDLMDINGLRGGRVPAYLFDLVDYARKEIEKGNKCRADDYKLILHKRNMENRKK